MNPPFNSMLSIERNPTPFPEVNWVLRDLLERARTILGEHFIGMYLYGSLATGDFNPSRSDIDFVVISDDHLPGALIAELETMHLALARGSKWQRKLEGAYVPTAVIRRQDAQSPSVPTVNEGSFYKAPLGSDWVMQRKILRETECAVYGPSLRALIDPISSEDLRAAVLDIMDNWWEPMLVNQSGLQRPGYQPFAVLSMCRSLYTMKTGELASKTQAAEWAIVALPAEWAPLINHALQWADGDAIESVKHTATFMRYVIELCHASGGH